MGLCRLVWVHSKSMDTNCGRVHEEESSPLLCGFTATLFGSMPLAYEDSVEVKMVKVEIIHYLIF